MSPRSHAWVVFLAFLVVAVGTAAPLATARADALDDAKRSGLVGETARGYLAPVKAPAAAEVIRLVNDINGRRRAKYDEIARSRGVSLEEVEQLVGSRLVARARAGEWVMDSNGAWHQK